MKKLAMTTTTAAAAAAARGNSQDFSSSPPPIALPQEDSISSQKHTEATECSSNSSSFVSDRLTKMGTTRETEGMQDNGCDNGNKEEREKGELKRGPTATTTTTTTTKHRSTFIEATESSNYLTTSSENKSNTESTTNTMMTSIHRNSNEVELKQEPMLAMSSIEDQETKAPPTSSAQIDAK